MSKLCLLICNRHDSHISSNFITYCIRYNIELLLLLPYSLHYTQLLDIAVFSSLAIALDKEIDCLIFSSLLRISKAE